MKNKNIRYLNIVEDNVSNQVFIFSDKIKDQNISVFSYEKTEKRAIEIEEIEEEKEQKKAIEIEEIEGQKEQNTVLDNELKGMKITIEKQSEDSNDYQLKIEFEDQNLILRYRMEIGNYDSWAFSSKLKEKLGKCSINIQVLAAACLNGLI